MTEDLTEKRKMLEVMGNDDLFFEIILRLPVESIYRFKCVSRHWHSLISSFISNPKYCSTHTQKNHKSSIFGVYVYLNLSLAEDLELKPVSLRAGQSLPTLEFLDLANNVESVVLHASNGLFLYATGNKQPFAICNLTTQKFHLLPQHLPHSPFECFHEGFAHLVFDPEKSLHYKVVCIAWLEGNGTFEYYRDDKRENRYNELDGPWYEIDIYTSETRTWKRKHLRASFDFHSQYKVVWNGAVHWMNYSDFHVWFEVDTETLNANPLPPQIKTRDDDQYRYFGECCGRAFLIHIERQNSEQFHVLEMDNEFNWTTTKYSFNTMYIPNTVDEIFESWKFSILCAINEDENNDMRLLLALPGKIILLDTMTSNVLCQFPPTVVFLNYPYNHAIAFQFIPTLYPV